jgi:hypothetical protein
MVNRIGSSSSVGAAGRGASQASDVVYVADTPMHSLYDLFGSKALNPNGAGENPQLFADLDALKENLSQADLATMGRFLNYMAGSVEGIKTPDDRRIMSERLRDMSHAIDRTLGYKISMRGSSGSFENFTPCESANPSVKNPSSANPSSTLARYSQNAVPDDQRSTRAPLEFS